MRPSILTEENMKTLGELTEEELVAQARNYATAIGRDPNTIVSGEDAKKYLDYIAADVEHARSMGWNCD